GATVRKLKTGVIPLPQQLAAALGPDADRRHLAVRSILQAGEPFWLALVWLHRQLDRLQPALAQVEAEPVEQKSRPGTKALRRHAWSSELAREVLAGDGEAIATVPKR